MLKASELRRLTPQDVKPTGGAFTGTVTRVDSEGTAWCQVDGASEPTPCSCDMSCAVGDVVTIRIADHRATVTGNATSPATDDATANVAKSAAATAQVTASAAQATAMDAERYATVAHAQALDAITSAASAATAATNAQSSADAAARSAVDALNNLAVTQNVVDALGRDLDDLETHVAMTDDGLHIVPMAGGYYAVLGTTGLTVYNASGVVVGHFGEEMQLGALGAVHMEADSTGLSFIDADGARVAYIEVDAATGESTFYMTRSVVVKDLTFGDWKWRERENGNMSLKWIGA